MRRHAVIQNWFLRLSCILENKGNKSNIRMTLLPENSLLLLLSLDYRHSQRSFDRDWWVPQVDACSMLRRSSKKKFPKKRFEFRIRVSPHTLELQRYTVAKLFSCKNNTITCPLLTDLIARHSERERPLAIISKTLMVNIDHLFRVLGALRTVCDTFRSLLSSERCCDG